MIETNSNSMQLNSCPWPANNALAIKYHDLEWGVPVHSDIKHFEYLLLDAFQAGLSWNTILNKRENFRSAFDQFNYFLIANYDEEKIFNLMSDPGIVRNKLKIESTIGNAKAFLKVIDHFGSFDNYIWQFVNGKPIINQFSDFKSVPAKTRESDAMSRDLLKKGFRFVGSTICYAYMQAAGMVNDHLITCYRHKEVQQNLSV